MSVNDKYKQGRKHISGLVQLESDVTKGCLQPGWTGGYHKVGLNYPNLILISCWDPDWSSIS